MVKARVKPPLQHFEDEAKKKGTVECRYDTQELMLYWMGASIARGASSFAALWFR